MMLTLNYGLFLVDVGLFVSWQARSGRGPWVIAVGPAFVIPLKLVGAFH